MLCTSTLQISVEVVYMLKHWAWIETLCCDSNTHPTVFIFSIQKENCVPPSPSNFLAPRNIPTSLEKITSVLSGQEMAAFLCPFSAKPWSKVSWNHWDYFYWLRGLLFSPEYTAKFILIFGRCGTRWRCCERGPLAQGRSPAPPEAAGTHPMATGTRGCNGPRWAALLPLKLSVISCFDF